MTQRYSSICAAALFAAFSSPAANPDFPNLEEVIIATKCHLDVGYTATVPELMRKYSTTDLDNAFTLFDSDKDKPADLRARWTVPAWAMDVMLEKVSPGRRSRLEEAIRQRRLMWHAYPFTIETEASDLEELVRMWEQAGKGGEITVTLPEGLKATSAQPVNLRGEATGEPIAIKDGVFSFVLGAWAPKSFVLSGGVADVTAVEPYRYEWYTADDTSHYVRRNPVAWRLQGSNDGEKWTDLDAVGCAAPHTFDKSLAYSRRLDIPRALPEDTVVYPLSSGDGRHLVTYEVNGTTIRDLVSVEGAETDVKGK